MWFRMLILAFVSFLTSGVAHADQSVQREQPVTHLSLPACNAANLKLLAARQKFSDPPPKTQRVGKWLIVQWPRVDVNSLDDTAYHDLTDNDFIEIYRAGSDPKRNCQLLVTGEPGHPNAVIGWQRKPLRDEPKPELILGSYSGGVSGCCWTTYIVSLGESLAVDRFAPVYGNDGEFDVTFSEADPIVPPDIRLLDWSFFGWQGNAPNFGATAFYTLIWRKDRYVLEPPKRSAPPTPADLAKWKQEMTDALMIMSIDQQYRSIDDPHAGDSNLTLNPVIWQHMLDLIYDGYTEMVVKLLNRAWPKEIKGKDLFWQDFHKQLQQYSLIWDARHLDQILPKHLPESH
jgi:hypothetical protein